MLTLEEIRQRYNVAQNAEVTLYELDTIERLIIPVLAIAGWDIDSLDPMHLLRGNQSNSGENRRFDLQLFAPPRSYPRIVVECKYVRAVLEWKGYGWREKGREGWQNDYLRQIRNDCRNRCFCYEPGWTIPVVTNGYRWILLTDKFVQTATMSEGITDQNRNEFILADGCLCDDTFADIIIAKLKPETVNKS